MNEDTAALPLVVQEAGLDIVRPEPVLVSFQVDRELYEALGERARRIIMEEVPAFLDTFMRASVHYGDTSADTLGVAGQYADMHRKFGPLKRALWDGQVLTREQPQDILRDLIGHCFLTLEMMNRAARTKTGQ